MTIRAMCELPVGTKVEWQFEGRRVAGEVVEQPNDRFIQYADGGRSWSFAALVGLTEADYPSGIKIAA